MRGFEYRSAEGWRGIPVIHIAFGAFEGGRYRPRRATGLIAMGDTAIGMVAVGLLAIGGGRAGRRRRRRYAGEPTGRLALSGRLRRAASIRSQTG
jgi:hypothetical protein